MEFLFSIALMGVGWVSIRNSLSREKIRGYRQNWLPVYGERIQVSETGWAEVDTFSSIPDVHYRYRLGGHDFYSNAIMAKGLPEWAFASGQEDRLSHYQASESLVVHYNPDRPWESYLELEADTHWIDGLLGLGLMIIGMGMVVALLI